MVKVAPSLLAANFMDLKNEVKRIEEGGASWIHYDVMDGHFVPNISFGYSILKDISKCTNMYLDVHLMISDPKKYYPEFVKAGANLIVFHIEAVESIAQAKELLLEIKQQGVDVGISIKPQTPVSTIETLLEIVDVVLVMSVEPGFGGQVFHHEALDKIAELANLREKHCYHYLIEVDGGINEETGKLCIEKKVDVLVAGSYIFQSDDYQTKIEALCI
ncbi:ribulose-phosphate 3-epimerase [Tannockella kyphosi]|uniref:ribulose-phosphate 3-epimerase n=1 Tax=Tannockella kyphosi TaxID=2899121 RepID=UPI0020131772|nr:ribulose-phosphate 3-epimerase [Tannockella kyphosi]